jgi:hypothetical protein
LREDWRFPAAPKRQIRSGWVVIFHGQGRLSLLLVSSEAARAVEWVDKIIDERIILEEGGVIHALTGMWRASRIRFFPNQ